MNNLAITPVIVHSVDRYWAMQEVQLTFDEVASLFFAYFQS
jgi:hypothetical protein